jgi:hypothetical protein
MNEKRSTVVGTAEVVWGTLRMGSRKKINWFAKLLLAENLIHKNRQLVLKAIQFVT